jgi:hypothetical protein
MIKRLIPGVCSLKKQRRSRRESSIAFIPNLLLDSFQVESTDISTLDWDLGIACDTAKPSQRRRTATNQLTNHGANDQRCRKRHDEHDEHTRKRQLGHRLQAHSLQLTTSLLIDQLQDDNCVRRPATHDLQLLTAVLHSFTLTMVRLSISCIF